MSPGRPRKPRALAERDGSIHARHKTMEPTPVLAMPPMPQDFNKELTDIWTRVTSEIASMGLLAVTDGVVLERYCRTLARWRYCERHIAANGLSYPVYSEKPDAGYLERLPDGTFLIGWREWPEVRETHRCSEDLRRLESNFGLDPVSRTKFCPRDPYTLAAEGKKKGLDLERFFGVN